MKNQICVSFRNKRIYIAGKMPADSNTPYYIDSCARSDMENRLLQARLRDPATPERRGRANCEAEWLEIGYPAGQLVFACLDINWAVYCARIDALLEQYAGCRIALNSDLLPNLDWDALRRCADVIQEERIRNNTPAKNAAKSDRPKPAAGLKNILSRLHPEHSRISTQDTEGWSALIDAFYRGPSQEADEIPEQNTTTETEPKSIIIPEESSSTKASADVSTPLYSHAVRLYQELYTDLNNHPAMQDLIRLYCTQLFGGQYTEVLQRLSIASLTEEQRDIFAWIGSETGIPQEAQKADMLVSCSFVLQQLLRGADLQNSPIDHPLQRDDGVLNAAAWDLLQLLQDRLQELAAFQPHLQQLVDATLLIDGDETKPEERYRAVSYHCGSSYHYGEVLRRQLTPEILPCLSAPTNDRQRKLPELLLQMHFGSDRFAGFVMLDWEQMCLQRIAVRPCAHCGRMFVPFSSSAKYCTRSAPDETQLNCKDAAAKQLAAGAPEDPWKKRYNQLANNYNLRLTRSNYAPDRRKAIMKMWHSNAKEAMAELMVSASAFTPELLDEQLEQCFSLAVTADARAQRGARK